MPRLPGIPIHNPGSLTATKDRNKPCSPVCLKLWFAKRGVRERRRCDILEVFLQNVPQLLKANMDASLEVFVEPLVRIMNCSAQCYRPHT